MPETAIDQSEKKKPHRERKSGRKTEKKKDKKVKNDDKQPNPKAFAFNSAIRAERRFRRKQDILTKKYHLPEVDRTPLEPPPIVVAVVGPPKVGKSTLINNLIKLFTKSPLTDIKGPVTIVTGKKRRVTFIECNNDVNCMIDLAKVADLVLVLCDASFGFEMEVFEFLTICKSHGMPRIMGILTHLDKIKNSETLKNTKKTLKHRFWKEVYDGAKLFNLSGILHGEYMRNEIKNLGRFISVMTFRPLTWRTTHSYLLADRYEDLTNQDLIRKDPKCSRKVSLYGYVRGIPLKKDTSVHIAGMGDFRIQDITYLPDPCPLPEQIKKRALIEKEKLIYAPFSGVGGIVYDKDAVYIELGGSHSHKQKDEDDETQNIVSNLMDTKETLDMKIKHSAHQLFTGGVKITALDTMEDDDADDVDAVEGSKPAALYKKSGVPKEEEDLEKEVKELRNSYNHLKEEIVVKDGRKRRKVIFEAEDSYISENQGSGSDSDTEEDGSENDNDSVPLENDTQMKKTGLKVNKDKTVLSKITHTLKFLDKKAETKSKHLKSSISTENETDSENEADLNPLDTPLERKSLSMDGESEDSDEDAEDSDDLSETNKDEEEDNEDADNLEEDQKDNESSSDESANMDVKWKDNLTNKARNAFLDRLASNQNLNKLIYGSDTAHQKKLQENEISDSDDNNSEDEIFKKVSDRQMKLKDEKANMDKPVYSVRNVVNGIKPTDILNTEYKGLIANLFVTGKWDESEDASELLKLDDAEDFSDDNSEIFGDFEDLETGEKHEAAAEPQQGQKRKNTDGEDEQSERDKIAEKKRKLKEKFDAEYDGGEKATYYDELKASAEKQAQLNKSVFENLPDEMRVHVEGFRAGMYVRIEFESVPHKFVTNFDPTYPLVIGALNSVEGNISYVNVRMTKHRYFKRILKTNDPIIISLGWRRFQTLPIYSKLEDDLKFRYLKYTPQHIGFNAHFWGPITPSGAGLVALQSVESNPEVMKKQGFRIVATGVVHGMDSSTQIMKKLKLIGHPMKIYKKTAFIKGMFHNSIEVAKFEGARLRTVSGIRGQIKKAISKPEGCFRATFEDKILLSDIVFCRTWYKVDVTEFYKPIKNLLLPLEQKNSWRGLRTVGEIKREKGIQNLANKDSLYTPIVREEKPFKPLVIPAKLQQALPYRDKPNHGVKMSDKKKSIGRVAVVLEPQEKEVSNLMKMIKTTYEHKQDKLKTETKERLEKHRQLVTAQEAMKDKKLKQKKKEVFRRRTKAQAKHND